MNPCPVAPEADIAKLQREHAIVAPRAVATANCAYSILLAAHKRGDIPWEMYHSVAESFYAEAVHPLHYSAHVVYDIKDDKVVPEHVRPLEFVHAWADGRLCICGNILGTQFGTCTKCGFKIVNEYLPEVAA